MNSGRTGYWRSAAAFFIYVAVNSSPSMSGNFLFYLRKPSMLCVSGIMHRVAGLFCWYRAVFWSFECAKYHRRRLYTVV